MAENDGVVDGPGHNTLEAKTMASCFHLLFNCLQTLFAWFVSFNFPYNGTTYFLNSTVWNCYQSGLLWMFTLQEFVHNPKT